MAPAQISSLLSRRGTSPGNVIGIEVARQGGNRVCYHLAWEDSADSEGLSEVCPIRHVIFSLLIMLWSRSRGLSFWKHTESPLPTACTSLLGARSVLLVPFDRFRVEDSWFIRVRMPDQFPWSLPFDRFLAKTFLGPTPAFRLYLLLLPGVPAHCRACEDE